ncbi:hypothetical protein K493DRAFT_296433 [Basidiobolus meristosporus CBS 931.73]|uniref:Uncharacterized protein n=1 Tax=Basidiobolus meristosporus CBS 931.73 TaxID=1314790 RepID=A0A1Y1Z5J1_9FUNG|nr:hypothetical protein K493DRAFT_296433 [Basidiobolus meristosporus CBS 931.73]|eukprot:ORY05519.1 hypothetical protein K493DRAFT_296433 [Basidiobolus meristosporus CBS 931.73]
MALGIDLDSRELPPLPAILPGNPTGSPPGTPTAIPSVPAGSPPPDTSPAIASPTPQQTPAPEDPQPTISKTPDHASAGNPVQPPGNTGGNGNSPRVTPTKHTSILTMTASSAGKIRTIIATETLEVMSGQPETQLNTNNVPSYAGSGGNTNSDSKKPLITTAIVLGSVLVAGVGIWIFRKWKVSPSADFQQKLANVDYFKPPGHHDRNTVFLRELNEP